MSRDYHGERWQSRSNGLRLMGNGLKRGRLARKLRSAGVPPAMTNAGKMPAIHRGIGLNSATARSPVNGA
jgi:hypothetical protein